MSTNRQIGLNLSTSTHPLLNRCLNLLKFGAVLWQNQVIKALGNEELNNLFLEILRKECSKGPKDAFSSKLKILYC